MDVLQQLTEQHGLAQPASMQVVDDGGQGPPHIGCHPWSQQLLTISVVMDHIFDTRIYPFQLQGQLQAGRCPMWKKLPNACCHVATSSVRAGSCGLLKSRKVDRG
jgi:hypothetical protein